MNPQDGNVLCPGHLNRAGCSSKDGAFYEEEQGAVIHQVPISLIERRPAAFGVPHHMNPVGQLAYAQQANSLSLWLAKGRAISKKSSGCCFFWRMSSSAAQVSTPMEFPQRKWVAPNSIAWRMAASN